MSETNIDSMKKNDHIISGDIQVILSKSYTLFLFCFVLGLVIDVLIRLRINIPSVEKFGLLLVILSTLIIYWAQTVNKVRKYNPDGTRNFSTGPYAYSRHPTYLGIFILLCGSALLMNSISILATSFVSYIISIFTFMEKEERRHIKKYGQVYLDYMKKVRKVI